MADDTNCDTAGGENKPDHVDRGQPSPKAESENEIPPTSHETNKGATMPHAQSGGGGGGDDDDDDDDDDREEDDGNEDDGDIDSSDEQGLVVLDPDHPLMKRFQAALKSLLGSQDRRLSYELRELENGLKTRVKDREELGVDLYGIQQELARYQQSVEQLHDEYAQKNQQRQRQEQQLMEARTQYKETQLIHGKERMRREELEKELENLALRLFYMGKAKTDVRSDIAIMRRAAEKVETEVLKAEVEKQKQDLYVDRLVERVDKMREDAAMYEAQLAAQSEETRAAVDTMMEAHMEIEAIKLEKKQLYQQWNSSLLGMQRRDEARAAMQEGLRQQEQTVLSLNMEIEGYRKSIQKEQEYNEKLTLSLARTERDIESVTKQLNQSKNRFDALKAEYTLYNRTLQEIEQFLSSATADKTLRQNDLVALRKQIEHEVQEKLVLEDQIFERVQTQLTLDKASQYSKKLIGHTREHTKFLESQRADTEHNFAKINMETITTAARVEQLRNLRERLENKLAERNKLASHTEAGIQNRNAIIQRKQSLIDQYNKRLDTLIHAAGGAEISPMELEIVSAQRSVDILRQTISAQQQQWLKTQQQLVELCQDKECQAGQVEKLSRKFTIFSQRKIRIENEIEGHVREKQNTERNIRVVKQDVVRLNLLIHKEKNMETDLESINILTEKEFVRALKDAEKESIELATKVEDARHEKERLLNNLVETEQQAIMWERKIQLGQEMREAAHSSQGAMGDINTMKKEVHRMTVRYNRLLKTQEKMIQEMEKSVARRDAIVWRGEIQMKMSKKVLTKANFERQMSELHKKMKATVQKTSECQTELDTLQEQQGELGKKLEEKQADVATLHSSAETLQGDIGDLQNVRHRNLLDIVKQQQRSKYYKQLQEGHYTRLCSTDETMLVEHNRQEQRSLALADIVERLTHEFPQASSMLHRTSQLFHTRSLNLEDST